METRKQMLYVLVIITYNRPSTISKLCLVDTFTLGMTRVF